ncbi:hypothetical protein [Flavobacterium sp. ZS1P14]|uniref:hypothetical protein n=1 Tax=Flavobacterium sp. ZS1P14 TaxID=3401729 RepID=UPI003AABFEA1
MSNAIKYYVILIGLLFAFSAKAQVGIGTNEPNDSAQLEVLSTSKGVFWILVTVVTKWSWIFCFFGFGSKYLNKPNTVLAYCNEAVYPFYILHQTVTIVLGYYVMNLDWGFLPKFSFLSFGTFIISWLIYEFLIRRNFLLRPFFGLTNPKKKSK